MWPAPIVTSLRLDSVFRKTLPPGFVSVHNATFCCWLRFLKGILHMRALRAAMSCFKLDWNVKIKTLNCWRWIVLFGQSEWPEGWRFIWLSSLNWPFRTVSYLNFLYPALCFCSVILLVWLSNWFMSYLKMTFDPQPIPHLSILPSVSVLLPLLLLCLGWLMLHGSPVYMEWKHQQQAACFLICHDPPLTHFLPHSHPAPNAGSRKTNHSPLPQRLPIANIHTHSYTRKHTGQPPVIHPAFNETRHPALNGDFFFCRSGLVGKYGWNSL